MRQLTLDSPSTLRLNLVESSSQLRSGNHDAFNGLH